MSWRNSISIEWRSTNFAVMTKKLSVDFVGSESAGVSATDAMASTYLLTLFSIEALKGPHEVEIAGRKVGLLFLFQVADQYPCPADAARLVFYSRDQSDLPSEGSVSDPELIMAVRDEKIAAQFAIGGTLILPALRDMQDRNSLKPVYLREILHCLGIFDQNAIDTSICSGDFHEMFQDIVNELV